MDFFVHLIFTRKKRLYNVIYTLFLQIMTAICIDCSSKKCIELLDIIEKIMLRPIELKNEAPKDANIKWADYHFEDIYQVK